MKLFLIFMILSFKANCETQVFEAYASYEGRPAYVERHFVTYDDDTLIKSTTEYLDPEGKVIGKLRSDFTHSLSAPAFIFQDTRYKSFQGLKWEGQKAEVFSRDRGQKKLVKKILTPDPLMMGGEGLIYYIGSHLKQIIASNGLDFNYLIAGRLETFDFSIKPIAHNDEQAEFEVGMKSWFMSFFGPRLKLIYDVKKRRLKSYEGVSNLRNPDGSMMNVDIQYLYKN